MRKLLALCLLPLAFLLTGCPYNKYTLELTPKGETLQRKLTFYGADGENTDNTPHIIASPKEEIALIKSFYPPDGFQQNGVTNIATGEFYGVMPNDVGGTGSYKMLTNNLGITGFYMERFRGTDDIAGRIQKHLKAADKLVDYLIGWSYKELGNERHYQDLRRFLDKDFRSDVRNLSLHGWMMEATMVGRTKAPEEYAVRFGQYLMERGYIRMDEIPELFQSLAENNAKPLMRIIRRLVAEKLKLTRTKSLPRSMAFLLDDNSMAQSWADYLATTTEYRVKLRHWQMEKASAEAGALKKKLLNYLPIHPTTNGPAPQMPQKPEPTIVVEELYVQLGEFNIWDTDDHITVKLRLDAAPLHSNGSWDERLKTIQWESDLEGRTNQARLPSFCYASWCFPNEPFQKAHFGDVLIKGDDLLQYSLWRGGLKDSRGKEWDAFMSGLNPGPQLDQKLSAFRFSDEPIQKPQPQSFPAQLINKVLKNKAAEEKN